MKSKVLQCLLALILAINTTNAIAQLTYKELQVEYDSTWTFKNLQLIPVKFKNKGDEFSNRSQPNRGIISLQEAMGKGKLKVKEIKFEQGADINWLEVTNDSKQTVIVNSGELIGGGKQDRMVGETKILQPGKTDYINVFCIEKGRWDDKPKPFTYAGLSGMDLRKVMDKTGRQHEVWKEIDRQFKKENKTDEAQPYLKLYGIEKITDSSYANYFAQKLVASDSSFAGFIAITGDEIINCELFSSADLTNSSYPFMIASLIETVGFNGSKPEVLREHVKYFMDQLLLNEFTQKVFVEKYGRIHLYQGKVIHLIAYGE
jgi:hypothetical protein